MKELSVEEKKKHHNGFKRFVKTLKRAVNPENYPEELELVEVGYGVEVDDAYFYFDWPYIEGDVEKLNQALTEKPLFGIDSRMHRRFHKANQTIKDNDDFDVYTNAGFLTYKYTYSAGAGFKLLDWPCHNLLPVYEDNDSDEMLSEDLLRFLPVMHCAYEPNDISFLEPVEIVKDLPSSRNHILVVSRTLTEKVMTNTQTHVLVCTFKVKDDFNIDSSLVANLQTNLLRLVKEYFDSPVLSKLISEYQKSEILSYQHTINNLRLELAMDALQKSLVGQSETSLLKFDELQKRFTVLRLMHYSLFETEHLRFDRTHKTKEKYFLSGLTIGEMLTTFVDSMNIFDVSSSLSKEDSLGEIDFIPNDASGGSDSEMYDIQLVLWNLWENACHIAGLLDENWVRIRLFDSGGQLAVSFENPGHIPTEYKNYLIGESAKYPTNKDQVVKQRHGLEIIREYCTKGNREWERIVERVEVNGGKTTIITLKFNRR